MSTAVAAPEHVPWWHLRQRATQVRDTLANPDPEARTLLSGRKVHLRFVQNLGWSYVVGAVVAVSMVAGWYYGFFEQHWYIHAGSFYWNGWTLKPWWDGGMHIAWLKEHLGTWAIYRHAIRNLGEPTVAWLFVGTLFTKPKYWDDKASALRIVFTIPALLFIGLVAIVGGTYLLYFGLPDLWANVATAVHHKGFTLDGYFSWAGKASLSLIVLGYVNKLILHRLWAPVGATLQGHILDTVVARGKSRVPQRPPLVEKLPIAPPTVRERIARMWRTYKPESAVQVKTHGLRAWFFAHLARWFLTFIVVFGVVSVILGLLARYPIAHGTRIPYLNP